MEGTQIGRTNVWQLAGENLTVPQSLFGPVHLSLACPDG